MLPMIFRKVDLSFEKLGQWRRKWTDLSISLPQLQIGLNEYWKLCLNLCSGWWLEPNLNLVNKSVTLGLWQLKTVLNIQKCFLEDIQAFWIANIRSSLFHSITAEGKKEFWKKFGQKKHSFLYHLLFSRVSKPTIIFIIFWDFFIFYQISLSPQAKRSAIISNKHGIYELPNDLRLRILGN